MQSHFVLRAVTVPFLCLAASIAQSTADQTSQNKSNTSKAKQLENRVLDLVAPTTMVIEGRDTKVAPLSAGQKLRQVERNFFNPFVFVGVGVEAGFDQALDIHHGYGQGAAGYGKRYGSDLADTASSQLFGIGVYPSIFHTDPRYYRMGTGGTLARSWYSATRVLVTRTDSGRSIFNASEVLGAATSSGISRLYYPTDERTFGDFAYSMGSRIAFDAAYNLAKEFWPNVRNHIFGRPK
ncbi:MAG TPA: hypothetical protein VG498_22690 [Terriglobales bacterium]|nr:hypothetical protein [Terriglobales bacterium]